MPFSLEQESALNNLRQGYDAWIDAERDLAALSYDLRRKKVGEYEYLYEIYNRSGNGTSLGAWNEEKQRQFDPIENRSGLPKDGEPAPISRSWKAAASPARCVQVCQT